MEGIRQPFCSAIAQFRDGRWITRERVMYCGLVFSLISLFLMIAGVVTHTRNKFVAANGEQLGLDFINYFAGAKVALRGQASLIYDRVWLRGVEEAITGPATPRMYSYPPVTLLLSLPLAAFSFPAAFAVWIGAGAGACVAVLRRLVGWRAAALAVIGTPAAFFNVYGGQNAYFTAALLGGGLLTLERWPVPAGICFGCLAYKPHMALLLPVALGVSGRWVAFAAAAATAALLVLASLALFGTATWLAFFGQLSAEGRFLDAEVVLSHRMPTVFVMLRALGASPSLAYAAQLVSGVAAAGAVAIAWRSPATFDIKAAILLVAIFLATPHAWDYDEVVLVFAVAWLWRDGSRRGFLPWERFVIVTLLVLPMPSIMLNIVTGIEFSPIVLWLALFLLLRRALAGQRLARPLLAS